RPRPMQLTRHVDHAPNYFRSPVARPPHRYTRERAMLYIGYDHHIIAKLIQDTPSREWLPECPTRWTKEVSMTHGASLKPRGWCAGGRSPRETTRQAVGLGRTIRRRRSLIST